jgi:hypothetical protein
VGQQNLIQQLTTDQLKTLLIRRVKMPHKPIIKTTISLVTLNIDDSVDQTKEEIKTIINTLRDTNSWNAIYKLDEKKNELKRVIGFSYPNVDRHPGHIHNTPPGSWQYKIEESRNTVDRLYATATGTIVSQSTTDKNNILRISVTTSITCDVSVLENTH